MKEERILKSMSNFSLKRLGSKLFKAFQIDGGDNYLELNFVNCETGIEYSVTVKPETGLTQGSKNQQLEAKVKELEEDIRRIENQLIKYQGKDPSFKAERVSIIKGTDS